MPERSSGQAVIVISSHVARGSVGNRASVFALETLSCAVWAVPTIILPWHPGHGPATRIVPGRKEFAGFLDDIANSKWVTEIAAILTGYMAAPWQVDAVARLVEKLKSNQGEVTYLCDPVIGDESGLYVDPKTAAGIRDKLIPLCDVSTPNRYELAWLTGTKPAQSTAQTLHQSRRLRCDMVLATSVPGSGPGLTGTLLSTPERAWMAEHTAIENPPNGPGDLTAAIYLAHHLAGVPEAANLARTTASVLEILERSRKNDADELPLERSMQSITRPAREISVREI